MAWVSPDKLVSDVTYSINSVVVKKYLLKQHNVNNIDLPSKRTHKLKGIVIHNTDRVGSTDDGRQYTAATLNNNVTTRTHFYVTELSAWQNLDLDDMNWSCGDGISGDGNNGCISLEIIMQSKNKDVDLKARDNGAKIAAYLLWQNNMTVDNMYTHNYFLNIRNGVKGNYTYLCTTPTPTRNCPYYIVWDWENFRKQVDTYLRKLGGKSVYSINTQEEVQNVYKAVSSAAIRSGMSKDAKIYSRVTNGLLYPVDTIYTVDGVKWLKHAGLEEYSMLNDGGTLFVQSGNYTKCRTIATVNIRATASLKGEKVDTLPYQTVVYQLANTQPVLIDGYHWTKIIYDNKICYIASEYLK